MVFRFSLPLRRNTHPGAFSTHCTGLSQINHLIPVNLLQAIEDQQVSCDKNYLSLYKKK
jgi:hypothetical protein